MRTALATFAALALTFIASADLPYMGWSSWNAYHIDINDSLIMTQADAIVEKGLRDLGYNYVNIDDGFFGGRDADGNLIIHPTRFPHGLRPVVDHIHSLGMKAGIYSDAGASTCGNFWQNDTIARGVGLYQHDDQDCRLFFRDLDFDFIKVDFCGGIAKDNHEKLQLDERQRYTEIAEAIKRNSDGRVRLNICRWAFPGTWARSIAPSWRMSPDIIDEWWSVRDIIDRNLYLSAYCREGGVNDMDMLEVGRGLTAVEDTTHFALWCIMSSPLVIGCDVTKISDEALGLLSNPELIALNQDPLIRQAHVVNHQLGGGYVLVKDLLEPRGKIRAVALYNPTDSDLLISADIAKDLLLSGKVEARDLLKRTDVGSISGKIEAIVPAHGTRIYRLEGETRIPRTLYEAETAYIDAYQDLKDPIEAYTGYYKALPEASGAMVAAGLGGSAENSLLWDEVEAPQAGLFSIAIDYNAPRSCAIDLIVNGKKVARKKFSKTSGLRRAVFKVRLQSGLNSIKLANNNGPMPDIDALTILH